mmetsp:Transcript_23109/g.41251  ORF Transcript_23109/g.41251 Transcript_23109/m.41251 type:complete len:901 (-) Transcript_23109:1806-4508(-)
MTERKAFEIEYAHLDTSTESKPGVKRKCCKEDADTSLLRLMLWKNFLLFKRNWKSLLAEVLVPFLICAYIVFVQEIANIATERTQPAPETLQLDTIPKCWGDDCITLAVAYTDGDKPWTDYVLNHIAQNNDLDLGSDIRVISEDGAWDLVHYIAKHDNTTQTAVLFCTGSYRVPENPYFNLTIPCPKGDDIFTYVLMTNSSAVELDFLGPTDNAYPKDYATLSVKLALDKAILSYQSQKMGLDEPEIEVSVQEFPKIPSRYLSGYDVISTSGPFYLFIPPMVTFVIVLTEIVREKEYRLRHGLAVMGMTASAYWKSWFITGLVLIGLNVNSLLLSGLLFQIEFFQNANYLIMSMVFGAFSLAMLMIAFFVSTLLTTTKKAYTFSYGFILLGLVMQYVLPDARILWLMYAEEVPYWVPTVRRLLGFYPAFHFSIIFGDVSHKAARHFNRHTRMWLSGESYSWNQYVSWHTGRIFGGHFSVFSSLIYTGFMMLDVLFYAGLTWYFDHTIESNRGNAEPFYFMCLKRFWGCKPKVTAHAKLEDEQPEDEIMSKILDLERRGIKSDNLRIVGLSKVFHKYGFGIKSKRDIKAVKPTYLEVENNEMLAILGHNGAGKTTLIGMLTGILTPSGGYASVGGYNILDKITEARKLLGVCPQHDILWDELTAREHLILFAKLKGLHGEERKREIEEKLAQVKLVKEADNPVGTYSGGMKRRLSVAISGIGNPKIIIMDEPTTGMDPINKREVWKLIQKLKKGRVMILTTHSMEEADILSDRVAIIVDGRIKCQGTSLNLKNEYGDGYRISLVSKRPDLLVRHIYSLLPSCKIIDESAGSFVVSVPLKKMEEIRRFTRIMENDEEHALAVEVRELVEDWGVSQTTLEEVFMRVTGLKASEEHNTELEEMR